MAPKKKSIGNQTRPAKKGSAQLATGSKDPRTGRGGRRHEWDKKRLTAARERLNLVKLDGTPDEIKKAQEQVDFHLAATKVSRKRKRKEESQTGGNKAPAAARGPAAAAPEPEPTTAPGLPFGPAPKKKKAALKKAPAAPTKAPSSWRRFADAIGSFFKKK